MQFRFRAYRTINDPVERAIRLRRLYSFFERPVEEADSTGTDSEALTGLKNSCKPNHNSEHAEAEIPSND